MKHSHHIQFEIEQTYSVLISMYVESDTEEPPDVKTYDDILELYDNKKQGYVETYTAVEATQPLETDSNLHMVHESFTLIEMSEDLRK